MTEKMTVAQVRRALHSLRQMWENHSPLTPICLTETIDDEFMTVADFCFDFVMSHHSKRQSQKDDHEIVKY